MTDFPTLMICLYVVVIPAAGLMIYSLCQTYLVALVNNLGLGVKMWMVPYSRLILWSQPRSRWLALIWPITLPLFYLHVVVIVLLVAVNNNRKKNPPSH